MALCPRGPRTDFLYPLNPPDLLQRAGSPEHRAGSDGTVSWYEFFPLVPLDNHRAVLLLAVIAAVVSYSHMYELALRHGEPE